MWHTNADVNNTGNCERDDYGNSELYDYLFCKSNTALKK